MLQGFLLASGMTLAGFQAGQTSLDVSLAMGLARDLSSQQDFSFNLVGKAFLLYL